MVSSRFLTAVGLVACVSATPISPILAADDVILIKSDGTTQVMKAAEYDSLEAASPIAARVDHNNTESPVLNRRCEQSTEFQVISDEILLGWDTAISQIVSSAGGDATISTSSGYSISNTLSIGSSISTSFAEGILGMSMSIDYSESWSTQYTQSLTFSVPSGKYGVIVSQPSVRRIQGHVWDGCTDGPDRRRTDFTSDSYESQSYGEMSWVKGVVRLCSSDQYPIPFCNGEGQHR